MNPDLILRSRRVVTPEGVREAVVEIREGKIGAVLTSDAIPTGSPAVDVGNWVVMPGLVDTHVHINEPGRMEWEGFETATRAAAAGGITTVVDMPLNSRPVTTSRPALEEKIQSASGKCRIDCGFFGGVVPGNARQLEPLIEAGVWGFKCFLTHSGIDDFPNVTESDLREALPVLAKGDVPLLVHAELTGLNGVPAAVDPRRYFTYLASRPRSWENEAIKLLVDLCRETGARVHIVHLSSAEALLPIVAARREGLPLTVETCPHYLFFTAEEVLDGNTQFKCAPPIRETENRERLWEGLKEGLIDFIVSDHSPSTPDLKLLDTGDFLGAWGGIAGLQFSLPAVWTVASRRGHSLTDMAEWMCRRPARFIGMDGCKGAIAPGYDADLVVWDPDATFTVEPSIVQHRHKLTPYAGRTLQGVVKMTFLRGQKIYDQGEFPAGPIGKLLFRTIEAPHEVQKV